MRKTLLATIEMAAQIKKASQIKVGRNFTDFFSDRIKQATTERSLNQFAERLMGLVDASPGEIYPKVATNFLAVSSGENAGHILAWIRQYPNIVGMLVNVKHEEREGIVDQIKVEVATQGSGVAVLRLPFDIGITVQCTTPLAHGGDIKAGNAALFRRMNILSTTGTVLNLPFYAGNSVRGIVRDLLADHFIYSLDMVPRRDRPPVRLWFFHCLYAGGALEEDSAASKAINAELGKSGIVNSDGVRRFRDMLPGLSMLGSALGNRIVCGRVQFGDLRPVCAEWGTGDISIGNMLDWQFLTRREDHEDHVEHHGMIASTEVIKPGAFLTGGVDMDYHITDLEKSALGLGLELLKTHSRLGAGSRRDFGGVDIDFDNIPDPKPYRQYLIEHKTEIIRYLENIEALGHEPIQAPDISDSQLF